jgi:hypothetical protein
LQKAALAAFCIYNSGHSIAPIFSKKTLPMLPQTTGNTPAPPLSKRHVIWLVLVCTMASFGLGALFGNRKAYTKVSFSHAPELGKWFISMPAMQQTTDSTCGAATVATLENRLGKNVKELDIARFLGTNAKAGTTYEQMVDGLKRLGYAVEHGTGGTVALLRERLEAGKPTLVEWVDWGGHWVIVVGYDTHGTDTFDDDELIFSDPSDIFDGARDGYTTFNAQRFSYMWIGELYSGRRMDGIWIGI